LKTLSAQAESLRYNSGVTLVWLVEANFDEYGEATVTRRYADSAFTLSSNTYDDILADNGLALSMSKLAKRAGIAGISSFSVALHDEASESGIADTYVLSNDEVVVYVVFVNGSEEDDDKIEIARGVVESNRVSNDRWTWRIKDGSRKLLRSFPVDRVDPVRYPYAFEPGQVFPLAFGNLNVGADNTTGSPPALAPMRMIDRFALTATAGEDNKTAGQPWQYYPQAGRLAKLPAGSYSVAADNVTTVDQPDRVLYLPGVRSGTSNDVTDWRNAIDGDVSNTVSVGTTDTLHVWFSGSPKLGEVTSVTVQITADGTYDYEVFEDATSKASAVGVTGDRSVVLTSTDFTDWSLALINLTISGNTSAVTVENTRVEVAFDDFMSLTDQSPELWQEVVGFEDQTAHYEDGAVVTGAGTALRNPVNQLEAMLRGSKLIGLTEAQIGSSFTAAATQRTDWLFDWFLRDIADESLLHKFCELTGIHLFPAEGGGFDVAVNEKTRDPSHFFDGDFHMPALNTDRGSDEWRYDFKIAPVDSSEILNEFALRYGLNGASGEYRKSAIASGKYRVSGTDARLSSVALTLTSATSDFVTDNVIAGEAVYVSGDIGYTVVTRDSATQLTITPAQGAGVSEITEDTNFWLGPNLRAECLLSQLSFKTINALGTQQATLAGDGGFKVAYVQDDDTADLMLDYLVEWFAYPRDRITFSVFHPAINLQRGDVVMLHHNELFTSKTPTIITTVNGAHSDSVTTLNVASNLLREDDHVFIRTAANQPEAMKVTAVDASTNSVTVTRGTLNTEAVAIPDGASIYRTTVKWLVTGLEPITPTKPFIRVEAMQMPNDYKPVGIAVSASSPTFDVATEEQKWTSGWCTLRNGRMIDRDVDSAISHAGPDSGTYTIVS